MSGATDVGDPGGDSGLEAEFDTLAGWTVDAVLHLGSAHAIPAACRGSGSPAALTWLAESLGLRPGVALLDAGAGLGGPAAWATARYGPQAVLAEPRAQAVAGSRQLFGLPAVRAWGDHMPFRAGAFDVTWLLGVLDSAPEPAAVLAEVRRVLHPDGRLGILAYVAIGGATRAEAGAPDGNRFPTLAELHHLVDAGGFRRAVEVPLSALPEAPVTWTARSDQVEEEIARDHASDPRWEAARRREAQVARLIDGGRIRGHLLCCQPQADGGTTEPAPG